MIFGTTYSHRHALYLGLSTQAFSELLNFKFDIIRFGCYWNEIEPEENVYDFSVILKLLDQCEQAEQKVIVTVGMKAPRWPEYYIPQWLHKISMSNLEPYVLKFIEKAIVTLQHYSCILYWQVENEPLDPSGPDRLVIPHQLLDQEVALVRSLDSRPVIVTLWGNEVKQRKFLPLIENQADIIGLDLYYKVPIFQNIFWGPRSSAKDIISLSERTDKQIWITELQAEPWESGDVLASGFIAKTMNETLLQKNYENALALQPAAILFWGYEYWYLKKRQRDPRLWNKVKKLIKK